MQLFDHVDHTDLDIFYQRNDPNDIRLGEVVLHQPRDYDDANIVLLGLPQDEGVQRNGGRIGAKHAPDAIRRCLYKYVAIDKLKLFDVGNSKIFNTLQATHDNHQAVVQQLLQDGKTVIVLGGGNDTSYPDCAALSNHTSGNLVAFNIDAHFDARIAEQHNSGTPYRQLLEDEHIQPNHFYEIAYQPFANSITYQQYLDEKGVTTYSLQQVHEQGLDNLLKKILASFDNQAIFWGLDMDVVRAADAPGVSAVNPTGLTGEEFTHIGTIAGTYSQTRIFEITEVNPTYDIDERTCRLAAATIWNFLQAR